MVGVFAIICTCCCGCLNIPLGALALGLGIYAISVIDKSEGRIAGRNLAIAGAICGGIALGLGVVTIVVQLSSGALNELLRDFRRVR